MGIIFLDVDGVLRTSRSIALGRLLRLPVDRPAFDPAALFWLRRLVRCTGAAVVLSSSWRVEFCREEPVCRAAAENLRRALEANGTPIADATPFLPGAGKGAEIAAWLRDHPCPDYAVLDDRDSFAGFPAVRAHWVPVDPARGLRYRNYLAARRLLCRRPGKGVTSAHVSDH